MTQSLDEGLGLPTASPWARYEACTGAFQLEQEAERLGQSAHQDSPAPRSGKRMHAYLAGQPDEDGREVVLTDTERTTADFLQERAQGEVQRIFGDEPVQQLNEKRYWLVLNGQKLASGRVDRVVHSSTVALVQDFKTGWLEPAQAEQNAQMKVLAVLVALHMPKTVREVIVQIISGPYGVTEARYDYPALSRAYEQIQATLKAINDPRAPLSPSPEACRFCGAINICQAVKNHILPVARTQVSALPDGARGAKLLDEIALLEKHFKEIKKYYERRHDEDPAYKLPGYGLVPGNEVREITDWDKAKLRLSEYLDGDQLKEAESYTLGKLESALAKSLKLTGKEAKEKLNQILGDLITRNPNKSSLKRIKGSAKVVSLEAT
jgi:hypothetical protein